MNAVRRHALSFACAIGLLGAGGGTIALVLPRPSTSRPDGPRVGRFLTPPARASLSERSRHAMKTAHESSASTVELASPRAVDSAREGSGPEDGGAVRASDSAEQKPGTTAPSTGALTKKAASDGTASLNKAAPREEHAFTIARLRQDLTSADASVRLRALREARGLRTGALDLDVRVLLAHESDVPVKRVAVQLLAQGDIHGSEAVFRTLRRDADPIVQVNAAFGLARAGDRREEAWLLEEYRDHAKRASAYAPALERTLANGDLRSPGVVGHFASIVPDPSQTPERRQLAKDALLRKLRPGT